MQLPNSPKGFVQVCSIDRLVSPSCLDRYGRGFNSSSSCIEVPFVHLSTVSTLEPSHPILGKLLNLGLQLVALHGKVIHSTNPWNQLSRISAANSVHQRSTNRAEVISHRIACGNGFALSILGKLVLTADMRGSRLVDNKVGCKC